MPFFPKTKTSHARRMLFDAKCVFVLTGAGISVASGIPSFRGKGGLYNKPEFLKWAFPESHEQDPIGGWQAFEMARETIGRAKPNAAHEALAAFARGREVNLFTQNVDGLHACAGGVAKEIHGSLHRYRCQNQSCTHVEEAPENVLAEPKRCPLCHASLRHDVVLFGENVRHVASLKEALIRCDTVLLVGTSGVVTDTGTIARSAKHFGKRVIEVDPSWFTRATFWTSTSIRQPAERALPLILT